MAKIVVGLSGGVDSSVAALLLKEQGHEVIGLFMRNWNDASVTLEDECPWIEDSNDALLVAEKLDIPFQVIDLSEVYKERIVDYMFHEYEVGRTPNPDILCNREIKFDVFLKQALALGADYVATGHYCRKSTESIEGKTVYNLLAGKDKKKDQSYFLCQLNQFQLSKALFPIGELEKIEVRKIAKKAGLITADKKDSQGLCFIGKVKLPDFLQQKLQPKRGNTLLISPENSYFTQKKSYSSHIEKAFAQTKEAPFHQMNGKLIGQHNGAHYFTIGQRKGIALGGFKEPLFVLGTNVKTNEIYVGEGEDHPGLYRKSLFISKEESHWLRPDLAIESKKEEGFAVLARIRYRQSLRKATLYEQKNGLLLIFENEQKAISKGQFAAWYLKDKLIGSGVIN